MFHKRFGIWFSAAMAVVLTAGLSAQAVLVEFLLYVEPEAGTFQVYAQASPGDNFGIASYGVPLIGTVLSADHMSPNGFGMGAIGNQGMGFSLVRSLDIANPVVNPVFHASQDTVTPGYVVKGFGQTEGNLTGAAQPAVSLAFFTEQNLYDAPLLLVTGTYDVSAGLDFDYTNNQFGANVFLSAGTLATSSASVLGTVIPEPASAMILGLACLGLLRRNARRA